MKIDGLTPQQDRIARMVSQAMTDKAIAAELHIGESAVNQHLQKIAKAWKLDTERNRRVQIAVRMARKSAA